MVGLFHEVGDQLEAHAEAGKHLHAPCIVDCKSYKDSSLISKRNATPREPDRSPRGASSNLSTRTGFAADSGFTNI